MLTLANYLSHRHQFVQVNEAASETLTVTNGVPQGSILGPILFDIYVHDMSDQTEASCFQYSDQINDDIKKIQSWSLNSNLIFNSQTTKSMLFTTSQIKKRHDFQFQILTVDGSNIERTSDFKLLGVIFSKDLKWDNYINKITTSSFGALKTLTRLKRFVSFKLRKQLAETLVLSRLDYGNAMYHGAHMYYY